MTSYAWVGLFAVTMASACELPPQYCEGEALPEEPPSSKPQARVVAQVLPVESTAVDILFVIDDSMSMMDEQEQLATWSSEMFDVLSASGELPDLHIAVTSSSVAISGLTQCQTGGSLHVGSAVLQGERFIRDVAGAAGRERNYTGTLKETFGKMARVGDAGCGFEQPFKAARLALTGFAPGAKGFLREDALLLVVFVTDEDDCSSKSPALYGDQQGDACSELGVVTSYRCFEHGVRCYDGKGSREFGERRNCRPDESSPYVESVSGFADYLKGLKMNPAQVVVAGIYGKPNGVTAIVDERITTFTTPRLADVCGGGGKEGSGATPAVRMNALMAEFGGRASHSSICESQLSWAMREVGLVTRGAATRSRCLRGALSDLDVSAPGLQPACRVEVVDDVGARVELPSCDRATARDCFTLAVDPACEETETQLAVQVAERAGNETVTVACEVVE
ncbi:MAG: hypothetical protein M4D80_26560 [Myxococcota bacterium]|nr:hypothetical protein [Deltaproteobacteria bacterium]MDQ3338744.1 hypothetical protein [Myxococcota bacterium]